METFTFTVPLELKQLMYQGLATSRGITADDFHRLMFVLEGQRKPQGIGTASEAMGEGLRT